jgi:hypothetical protein
VSNDRVRDEAERLVAAAVAAVSLAARGMGAAGRTGSGWATGSPECCVCPVCRLISAMRDPSADLAERLASGAGDFATGVTSMLRALSRGGHAETLDEEPSREGDEFWEALRRRAADAVRATASEYGSRADQDESTVDPWRAATTTPSAGPKPMAKKAVAKKALAKKAVKKATPPPVGAEPAVPSTPPPPSLMDPAPTKKAAKKAAKKAVKKAVPPPEEFG